MGQSLKLIRKAVSVRYSLEMGFAYLVYLQNQTLLLGIVLLQLISLRQLTSLKEAYIEPTCFLVHRCCCCCSRFLYFGNKFDIRVFCGIACMRAYT